MFRTGFNDWVVGMVSFIFYGGWMGLVGTRFCWRMVTLGFFLDFGQSFTMGCDYFTGWLSPRAVNGLGDYFEFDLLPKLEGLYAEEQLAFADLPYCKPPQLVFYGFE